jgi:hypothetical protein
VVKKWFALLLHPEALFMMILMGNRLEKLSTIEISFQFRNQLKLFFLKLEIDLITEFIFYSGIHFEISNQNTIFHPSTIDGCIIHDGKGLCGGMKIKSENDDYVWNTHTHTKPLFADKNSNI